MTIAVDLGHKAKKKKKIKKMELFGMLLGQLYCKHSKILNTFHSVLKEKLNIGLEFTQKKQ